MRDTGHGSDEGTSYYGRSPLKPAPFESAAVGGYIFLAGLAGAAQLIATIADLWGAPRTQGLVRRGRYLALLAPLLGAPLLIYDLHTPQRFYNMLRTFRRTSPMSIGTWVLMGFSGFSGLTATLQFLADQPHAGRWFGRAVRVAQVPAALAGAGLATYTAALLSATSTPSWAVAPRALAVRFAGSSIAAGAAALALGERLAGRRDVAEDLDALAVAALAAELAGSVAARHTQQVRGIAVAARFSGHVAGAALPIALKVGSGLLGRRGRWLGGLGALVALGGSLALRVGVLDEGEASARRPSDGFRLAKPPAGSRAG